MFLAEIPLSDFDFFETVNGIFEKKNNQERQKNLTTYSLTLDPCRWPIHVLILLSIYLCVKKVSVSILPLWNPIAV